MAFSHLRSKLPTFLSRSKKFPTFNKNATLVSNFRLLHQHQHEQFYSSFPSFGKFASLSGLGLKSVKKSPGTDTSTILVLLGSNGRRRMYYSSQTNNGKEPSSSFKEWLRKYVRSVGKCMVFVMIFGSLQMVPCSDRVHLVFSTELPTKFLSWMGWKYHQLKYRGKILSPTSPEGVRVERILRNIIGGMHHGLGLQQHDYHVSIYSPERNFQKGPLVLREEQIDGDQERMIFLQSDDEKKISSKRRGGKFGIRYGFKHVERMNWEVMLIDADYHNAAYFRGGKIVLYTGMLKSAEELKNEGSFKDADFDVIVDASMACTISHEVGHGLANHQLESDMTAIWLLILVFLPFCHHFGSLPVGLLLILIGRFFSRRDELEADRLGMMLMAAAGYDPRYAPLFRWSSSLIGIDEDDILSTHPSYERRAKMLAKDEAVKQAMDIYKKVKASQRFTFFN